MLDTFKKREQQFATVRQEFVHPSIFGGFRRAMHHAWFEVRNSGTYIGLADFSLQYFEAFAGNHLRSTWPLTVLALRSNFPSIPGLVAAEIPVR